MSTDNRPNRHWKVLGAMLLIVLCGCVLLLLVWLRSSERQRRAVEAIELANGSAYYEGEPRHYLERIGSTGPTLTERLCDYLGKDRVLAVDEVHLGLSSNRQLAPLKDLPGLHKLHLDGSVNDATLAHLDDLTQLKYMWLGENDITDDGLSDLLCLKQLEELHLDGREITDEGIAWIGKLQSLTALSLNCYQLTDAGLAHLSQLPYLKSLSIQSGNIGGAGLAALSNLRALESLELACERINDDAMLHIAPLKTLHKLELRGASITDEGLPHIEGLKNLKSLNLRGTKVTKPAADAIHLKLPDCYIEGDWSPRPIAF